MGASDGAGRGGRSRLHPFTQAVVVRALHEASGASSGASLRRVREEVGGGRHERHPAVREARALRRELERIGLEDMPAPTDYVALLLETLTIRERYARRRDAWAHIGINPHTGDGYLRANHHAMTWPVWKTLRDEALEPMRRPRARTRGRR